MNPDNATSFMTINLLILGLVIGSNNLAAALALGAIGAGNYRWRIVSVFGFFEFFIPLVGIWLGISAARLIQDLVSWLGPALIIILGVWTMFSGILNERKFYNLADYVTSWAGLIMLGAGLSVDNLVVGFSLGLVNSKALPVAVTIMVFSVIFTLVGIKIGEISKKRWERTAEITTGILLILLGLISAKGWF